MSSHGDVRANRAPSRFVAILVAGFCAGLAAWIPARPLVMAASLLADLAAPPARGSDSVRSVDFRMESDGRFPRARLYVPRVTAHRCLVVGHGVHYKGIDEPRLVRFATELAKAGAVVLTPELSDLADYRVTRSGAEVLGDGVRVLSERCPAGRRVGLVGFSFAGGLSLLAATEPRVSSELAYVTSVGGYHDLRRVLSFLLTDVEEAPSGPVHKAAHEYGVIVLLYEHLELFVPEEDFPVMKQAIRAWLEEDRARAWATASLRSTARSEDLFVAVATGRTEALKERLREALASSADELRALSPAGRLHEIPVPVYLLHGTGDSVIPSEETAWAEKELAGHPHRALITPLIEHVELDKHFRVTEAVELTEFMAGLL